MYDIFTEHAWRPSKDRSLRRIFRIFDFHVKFVYPHKHLYKSLKKNNFLLIHL